MPHKPKYENLREAIVEEAMAIIAAEGIEKLSMREVSRRLGVSHQAPYKHFDSRDHILAEILSRAFDDFARHLRARPRSDNPHTDLGAMGQVYLQFAAEQPLQYRLMFGTPLPDPDQFPEMMANAQQAFSLLREAVGKIPLESNTDLDALYVWSTMHGLASILHMEMFDRLAVSENDLGRVLSHVLRRIGSGLTPGS